jgi:hypothetical protein
MPRLLQTGLFVMRLLPGLTMLILAAALLGTNPSSGYVRWLETSYGIQAQPAGLFLGVSALAAIVWPLTAEGLRRAPVLDAIGMGVLTAPLWCFIGLIVQYTLTRSPVSGTTTAFFIAMFCTQAVLYIVSTGIRLWEMELRKGAG